MVLKFNYNCNSSYLYRVANNKRIHETIGATNWSIKTSLISQTPSVGTGLRR